MVLEKFSFEYVDSDQVIMWAGVSDFSKGEFNEPAFYGQDYNTMFESLLAVPFFGCCSPAYSLPVISSILTLFPFFFFAFICYRKQLKIQALLILVSPLILPPEYDFITSMPRGFVTGIFFASMAAIAVYYPTKKLSYFFFALLSITGIAFNPNGVLITLPCAFFLFIENYKNKSFYIWSFLGALPAAVYPLYVQHFYKGHANYNYHPQWKLEFTVENLKHGLSTLDDSFGYISPLYWYHSEILIILLLAIPFIFLIQKKWIWLTVSSLCILFTIITLGINKVYDSDGSVFLPFVRMYLAVPIMIILFVSFIKMEKWKVPLLLIVCVSFFSFINRQITMDDAVKRTQIVTKPRVLSTMTVSDMEHDCEQMEELCKKFNVDLIIISHHWYDNFINFGYPALSSAIPLTISPSNERRTWRLLKIKDQLYKTVLIVDVSENVKAKALEPGKKPINIENVGLYMFLIQNNSLSTIQLLKRLDIEVRAF